MLNVEHDHDNNDLRAQTANLDDIPLPVLRSSKDLLRRSIALKTLQKFIQSRIVSNFVSVSIAIRVCFEIESFKFNTFIANHQFLI